MNDQSFVEKEGCCEYCGMTWMTRAALKELDERYSEAEALLSSVGAEANIITVEPPRMAVGGYEPELTATSEVTVPSEFTTIEGCRAHVQYDTGSQTSLVTSAFVKSLGLTKFGEPCQKLIRCGLTGQSLTALKVHQLHFKVGMRVASTKVFKVHHIGVLGSPPSPEILEEMFPNRTRGCWSGE